MPNKERKTIMKKNAKKVAALVLAVFMLLPMFVVAVSADTGVYGVRTQLKAPYATSIVIDGVKDAGYGATYEIKATLPGKTYATDSRISFAWDENYIYSYIEVDDKTPSGSYGQWSRDGITLFYDMNNGENGVDNNYVTNTDARRNGGYPFYKIMLSTRYVADGTVSTNKLYNKSGGAAAGYWKDAKLDDGAYNMAHYSASADAYNKGLDLNGDGTIETKYPAFGVEDSSRINNKMAVTNGTNQVSPYQYADYFKWAVRDIAGNNFYGGYAMEIATPRRDWAAKQINSDCQDAAAVIFEAGKTIGVDILVNDNNNKTSTTSTTCIKNIVDGFTGDTNASKIQSFENNPRALGADLTLVGYRDNGNGTHTLIDGNSNTPEAHCGGGATVTTEGTCEKCGATYKKFDDKVAITAPKASAVIDGIKDVGYSEGYEFSSTKTSTYDADYKSTISGSVSYAWDEHYIYSHIVVNDGTDVGGRGWDYDRVTWYLDAAGAGNINSTNRDTSSPYFSMGVNRVIYNHPFSSPVNNSSYANGYLFADYCQKSMKNGDSTAWPNNFYMNTDYFAMSGVRLSDSSYAIEIAVPNRSWVASKEGLTELSGTAVEYKEGHTLLTDIHILDQYENLASETDKNSVGHIMFSKNENAEASIGSDSSVLGAALTLVAAKETTDDAKLKVDAATLSLSTNLGVYFYADKASLDNYDSFTMITADGKVTISPAEKTQKIGDVEYYEFRYLNINPAKLGDDIQVRIRGIKNNSEYLGAYQTYSVKQYCINKLTNDATSEQLKEVCKAILNYGAEAQKLENYKTDALVNVGYEANLDDITWENDEYEIDTNVLSSASLTLGTTITVNYEFVNALEAGNTVTIKYGKNGAKTYTYTAEGGEKVLSFSQMRASELAYSMVISVNDGAESTYSVAAYADAHKNNATYGSIVKAMMGYINAVGAYMNS